MLDASARISRKCRFVCQEHAEHALEALVVRELLVHQMARVAAEAQLAVAASVLDVAHAVFRAHVKDVVAHRHHRRVRVKLVALVLARHGPDESGARLAARVAHKQVVRWRGALAQVRHRRRVSALDADAQQLGPRRILAAHGRLERRVRVIEATAVEAVVAHTCQIGRRLQLVLMGDDLVDVADRHDKEQRKAHHLWEGVMQLRVRELAQRCHGKGAVAVDVALALHIVVGVAPQMDALKVHIREVDVQYVMVDGLSELGVDPSDFLRRDKAANRESGALGVPRVIHDQ